MEIEISRELLFSIYVLALAAFVGFEVISKVPTMLHTPLMSGSNAISGIIVVGGIVFAANQKSPLALTFAYVAVFFATVNVVGGFVVTDRMLSMFKKKPMKDPSNHLGKGGKP